MTQLFKPTSLIDESENIAKNPDLKALLNGRYRRGLKICRLEKNGDKYTPEFYNVFGFTAIASTNGLQDTTETRCLIFRMERNLRKVESFNPDNCPQAESLRAKLLMYRLKSLSQPLPEIDFKDTTANDRLIELFIPLMEVAPIDKHQDLMKSLKIISNDRIEEDQSGSEAQVLRAIQRCLELGEADKDRLPVKAITDELNVDIVDKDEWWHSRGVSRLCGRLGLKRGHMRDKQGTRAILIDHNHLERQIKRFIDPPTSTSENTLNIVRSSETNVETPTNLTIKTTFQNIDTGNSPLLEHKGLTQSNLEIKAGSR